MGARQIIFSQEKLQIFLYSHQNLSIYGMLTSLQYSTQRQTVQTDVRRFKQRSASRDLHGQAGETGVTITRERK